MKIFIYTLGCPKNFNDSQVAAGILEAAGHEVFMGNNDLSENDIEVDLEQVDAIMVNTCGFINDAKEQSIETIFDFAQAGKTLIVSGCLTQRYGEELYKEMPEVDIFVGVNEYEKLPEIIENYDGKRKLAVSEYEKELESKFRKLDENPYTATIKISEGCDNRCTYCAIPFIRGPYRSRPMELIIAEAEKLAKAGTKELILIAQDTTTYGIDIYNKFALSELLTKLCQVEGIEWIRVMYCYEDRITEELIDTIAREEKICKYLDIPIQHVSDNVLSAMKRRSTSKSIRDKIALIREKIPEICIRTTLIVGFPGETEDDFVELSEFVDETKFNRLGVFSYSPEEGTVACEMADQIDEDIKEQRKDIIMRQQMDISLRANEALIGKTLKVITEGIDEKGCYLGRTQFDAPGIDNAVVFTCDRELAPGQFVDVLVTDAFDYDIVGEAK